MMTKNRKYKQEYAIVTGASSGIGKCVTELLISKGVSVFALDIHDIDNPKAIGIYCDTSSVDSIQNTLKIIESHTSVIDYLILPAGILCSGNRYYLADLPLDEWNTVLNVNLTGVMLCIQTFFPLLKKSSQGAIITYSSEQVAKPIPKSAPYLISKVGIEALTKLAALEFIKDNIRVNCIRAATVDTNFLSTYVKEEEIRKKMRDEMNKKMPYGIILPEDIANLTWTLISSHSNKITGQVITIDSGILLK